MTKDDFECLQDIIVRFNTHKDCYGVADIALDVNDINALKQALSEVSPSRERVNEEWTPVTDGMRILNREVIACNRDGDMIIGNILFCNDGYGYAETSGTDCDLDYVVAYMEKPKPYKKELPNNE